jgi:hypothetical protein
MAIFPSPQILHSILALKAMGIVDPCTRQLRKVKAKKSTRQQ